MRIKHIACIIAMLSFISGCYWGISGKVIDAETQQPIEGAVVLAQWTKQHGFGFYYHTIYKTVETETDKNGKFSISGAYSFFVDKPVLAIHKNGYVAWRNDDVFPSLKKRTDYDVWENNYIYKLERFNEGYSRDIHASFLSGGIMSEDIRVNPKFQAAEAYERKAAEQEKHKKNAIGTN